MVHVLGMRVTLDGAPLVLAPPERPTLAQALSKAAASARARGRVIIEAKADGIALTDDQLSNPSDEPGPLREVTLTSAEPRALVKVTLDDAARAVGDLANDQRSSAAKIHAGRESEALQQLQGIFNTWQTVKDIVDRAQALLEHNLDEVPLASVPKGETVAVASKRLLNHLKSVRTSLTSQDWSTLADTLEYDLCAEADAWVKLLSALADHVGELPAMNSPSDTQSNSEAKHS